MTKAQQNDKQILFKKEYYQKYKNKSSFKILLNAIRIFNNK